MDRRLVDHIVNSNLVSRGAMQRMILRASKNKTGIVEQLLEESSVKEDALARELAEYYGLELVRPDSFKVNETALKFISKSMADKHGVLPFSVTEAADKVAVAVYNPEAAQSVVDSLKTATGNEPTVHVAPRSWLTDAIRHFYFGESWAAAPAHKAATREVGDVSDDMASMASGSGSPTEESSEIILDEVVVPPKPRKGRKRRKSGADRSAERERREEKVTQRQKPDREPEPTPKKGANSEPRSAERQRRRSSVSGEPSGEVEAALDEFDAFLDSATGWGASSGSSKIPGWDDEPKEDNPFSLKSTSGGDWDRGGFSLFDEPSEGGEAALRELIDHHEEVIERLRRELQQQRDIITALVEALAETGVVSKREIKHRVKRK